MHASGLRQPWGPCSSPGNLCRGCVSRNNSTPGRIQCMALVRALNHIIHNRREECTYWSITRNKLLALETFSPVYPPPELASDMAPAMRNMSQNIFVCVATLAGTPFPFYSPCDWLVGNTRWLGIPCCDFFWPRCP